MTVVVVSVVCTLLMERIVGSLMCFTFTVRVLSLVMGLGLSIRISVLLLTVSALALPSGVLVSAVRWVSRTATASFSAATLG